MACTIAGIVADSSYPGAGGSRTQCSNTLIFNILKALCHTLATDCPRCCMRRSGWFDEKSALKDGAEKRLKMNRNSGCTNCSCSDRSSCLKESSQE